MLTLEGKSGVDETLIGKVPRDILRFSEKAHSWLSQFIEGERLKAWMLGQKTDDDFWFEIGNRRCNFSLERMSSNAKLTDGLFFFKKPPITARELSFRFKNPDELSEIAILELLTIAQDGEFIIKTVEFKHKEGNSLGILRTRFELCDGMVVRARQDVKPFVYASLRTETKQAFIFRVFGLPEEDGSTPIFCLQMINDKGVPVSTFHTERDLVRISRALANVSTFNLAVKKDDR